MLYLYDQSSKILRYTVSEVPTGTTVASANWTLKRDKLDPDGSALISLGITTNAGLNGQVTDNGAGDLEAVLEFYVGESDVADLTFNAWYHCASSVTLDNGESYVIPDSVEVVRFRPGL